MARDQSTYRGERRRLAAKNPGKLRDIWYKFLLDGKANPDPGLERTAVVNGWPWRGRQSRAA